MKSTFGEWSENDKDLPPNCGSLVSLPPSVLFTLQSLAAGIGVQFSPEQKSIQNKTI